MNIPKQVVVEVCDNLKLHEEEQSGAASCCMATLDEACLEPRALVVYTLGRL